MEKKIIRRVVARMYKSINPKTDEIDETLIQFLQEKRYFLGIPYWKTIDEEEVPSFAWIQRNALGFTDWKSKWYSLKGIEWTKLT